MILIIDNYDSFTYNLVQQVGKINDDIKVIRNDELSVNEIELLNPEAIILSPGPGRPKDAGICEELIQKLAPKCKILGVCLGHQAICETFGMKITYARKLMHGKQSTITINTDSILFRGVHRRTKVARYHSLIADQTTITNELEIIGVSDLDEVMAIKHKKYQVYGVQFHPESILTLEGNKIIKNFIYI